MVQPPPPVTSRGPEAVQGDGTIEVETAAAIVQGRLRGSATSVLARKLCTLALLLLSGVRTPSSSQGTRLSYAGVPALGCWLNSGKQSGCVREGAACTCTRRTYGGNGIVGAKFLWSWHSLRPQSKEMEESTSPCMDGAAILTRSVRLNLAKLACPLSRLRDSLTPWDTSGRARSPLTHKRGDHSQASD